jgi:DNA transposition AAA+ family ATPase
MHYVEENELRERMRLSGLSLKKAAQEIGLRPGTLSSKLTGWSFLHPEERRALEHAIQQAEERRSKQAIKTSEIFINAPASEPGGRL